MTKISTFLLEVTMLQKADVGKFLAYLKGGICYGSPDITDPMVLSVWADVVSDFSREELSAAAKLIIRNDKVFPSPSRVREAVLEAKTNGQSGGKFSELVLLIQAVGRYNTPKMEPIMAEAVRRMGGWTALCDWTDDDLPFRKKDFEATYRDILSSDEAYKNALRIAEDDKAATSLLPRVEEALKIAEIATDPIPDKRKPLFGFAERLEKELAKNYQTNSSSAT